MAKQKCDDLSGNPKDVCVKEAKAARTTAKADATVQMKTGQTNSDAKTDNKEVRTELGKRRHRWEQSRLDKWLRRRLRRHGWRCHRERHGQRGFDHF